MPIMANVKGFSSMDQVHGQKELGPTGMWDTGTGGANGEDVVEVYGIRAAPLAFCQTALTAAAIPVRSSSPLGSPAAALSSAQPLAGLPAFEHCQHDDKVVLHVAAPLHKRCHCPGVPESSPCPLRCAVGEGLRG